MINRWFVGCALAAALCANSAAQAKPLREARIEDLEAAKTGYVLKSKAFTPQARAEAVAYVAGLERRAGDVSDAEFLLDLMRIAAFAHNGHDAMDLGDDAWNPPTRLPFRMIWFPEGHVVARAAPAYGDLLGARVLTIEGLTSSQLLERLRPLCGGNDAYRKWDLEWVVENGQMLHTLGVAARADDLRMRFRLRDGRVVERRIPFIPAGEAASAGGAVGVWSPDLTGDERGKAWREAAPGEAPLYLQERDKLFRMAELPELKALYVQFRANYDENGQKIAPFVAAVSDRIFKAPPQNLVLDLRFDTGGDIDQTRALIRQIAQSVTGRIYVLVGRYTFSAGIASAAAMKHDAGERAVIVGEGLGDPLRWWSEIDMTCLPNSHVCLQGTHGLWDLVKGCAGEPGCYGDKYDARVGTLAPELKAPLTADVWLAGRDPGLDMVRADLAKR
jgi:hypothetical protein